MSRYNIPVPHLRWLLTSVRQAEVAKLHAHRRKYKQRFNDNLHVVGDRFSDIEERTTEAHDLYTLLSDRLEEHVDACHLAQRQLDTLQARMDETPDKASEPEMPPYFEEAKAKAKVLEEMVTGTCSETRLFSDTDPH